MADNHVLTLPLSLTMKEIEASGKGQSNEDVVTALYEQLRPSLLGYAYHLSGSVRDAEDLVQIAFLQLFDRLTHGSEIKNLRGWVYSAVHSLAINHASRLARRESLIKDWFPDAPITESKTAEEELMRRQEIEQALSLLGKKERQCLLLRAEGLSYQEIGEVLETSAKSVSVYLARGLKRYGSYNAEDKNHK